MFKNLAKLRVCIIILTTILGEVVCADACSVLSESYSDRSCYTFGQCGFNVFKLLNRLEHSGEAIAAYDVVFIMHELRVFAGGPTMPAALPVTHKRPGSYVDAFQTHFFIIHKQTGNVFDLDFLPSPTPVKDYVSKMFARSVPENVAIKRIGAHQYLQLLRERGTANNHDVGEIVRELKGNTPQWPEVRLADLLRQY